MKKLTTLVVLLLCLCTTQAQNVSYSEDILYQESSGRNIEPMQNAVIVPLVANLELLSQTRIEHVEVFEGNVTRSIINNIESYKRKALVSATKKYNADTMVAALINVDTRADGNALLVTVTGFPAKYVNFRSMTKEDTWLLQVRDDEQKSTKVVQ